MFDWGTPFRVLRAAVGLEIGRGDRGSSGERYSSAAVATLRSAGPVPITRRDAGVALRFIPEAAIPGSLVPRAGGANGGGGAGGWRVVCSCGTTRWPFACGRNGFCGGGMLPAAALALWNVDPENRIEWQDGSIRFAASSAGPWPTATRVCCRTRFRGPARCGHTAQMVGGA